MANTSPDLSQEKCNLCGSSDLSIAYHGQMRHSGINSQTTNESSIIHCNSCHVEFIYPFPTSRDSDKYENGEYWSRKGGRTVSDIQKINKKALLENLMWIDKIGIQNLVDCTIVDFGCGTGAFLDLVKGVAKATIGIEKDSEMASFARSHGHQVFSTINDACQTGVLADVIVSFDTFEHLECPLLVIDELNKILPPINKLFIGVPNQTDKLKELVPEYLSHFYHVEHLWYFTAASLGYAFQSQGFSVFSAKYLHKYNFMNLIEWVRHGIAPGNPSSALVDNDLDLKFKSWLEERGSSSHFLLEITYDQ